MVASRERSLCNLIPRRLDIDLSSLYILRTDRDSQITTLLICIIIAARIDFALEPSRRRRNERNKTSNRRRRQRQFYSTG